MILAWYISNDNKTLWYIEYALYKLDKTKISFEYHWPFNSKLCQFIFNYLKCHIVTDFVWYIWDYGSTINYNIIHSKAVHKNLLKIFYNKIDKKEYKVQIW